MQVRKEKMLKNASSSRLKLSSNGSQLLNIIKFIMPLIATNLLQELYHASDIMIVGFSTEPDAIGAVGSTSAFLMLIKNVFIGFSVGVNVVVARFIGAGDRDGASRASHTAICMSLIFGILGATLGIALAKTVYVAMGYEGKLLRLALYYSYIYLAGIPFLSLTNFLSAILQAKGDTRTSLYTLTVTGIVNVALNAVFVLIFGMSVEGVALATAISNLIACAILWVHLARGDELCRISFKKIRVTKCDFLEIARIGFPAGLQNALFSISNLLISSSIVQINNAVTPPGSAYAPVMKGHSASASIESFVFQVLAAVTVTASVFTARAVGEGNYKKAKSSFTALCIFSVCISALLSLATIAFRDPLLALYGVVKSDDLLATITYDTAMAKMFWKWPLFFTYSLMNAASGTLRGFGKSSLAALIALFGTCVLRVVWIFTIFRIFPTLESIFISYPISWTATGIVFFIIIFRIFKEKLGKSGA